MSKTPKAVILDIGGVVVGSPLVGINECVGRGEERRGEACADGPACRYEKMYGLPFDYLNVAITAAGREGAFQVRTAVGRDGFRRTECMTLASDWRGPRWTCTPSTATLATS